MKKSNFWSRFLKMLVILWMALFMFFLFYILSSSAAKEVKIVTCFFVIIATALFLSGLIISRRIFLEFTSYFSRQIQNIAQNKIDYTVDLELETLDSKLNHQLRNLHESSQGIKTKMEQDQKNVKETISDIAHQIRTPIANLKMYNTTLQERIIKEQERHRFRQSMNREIDKMDFLVQAMVKMSRLEAGIININAHVLPLQPTLVAAVESVMLAAEAKNIQLSVDCSLNIVALHDKRWTVEALHNLLDNAVKYTPANGSINITVHDWETICKIEIKDTGVGIAESDFAPIFSRFYRVEAGEGQDGVGIGLYLAREIIHRQGGTIKVESILGKGSVFSVFLPSVTQKK